MTMISASTYNVMYNSSKRWVKCDTTIHTKYRKWCCCEIILLVAYSKGSGGFEVFMNSMIHLYKWRILYETAVPFSTSILGNFS